jgi:hypothetical protein
MAMATRVLPSRTSIFDSQSSFFDPRPRSAPTLHYSITPFSDLIIPVLRYSSYSRLGAGRRAKKTNSAESI